MLRPHEPGWSKRREAVLDDAEWLTECAKREVAKLEQQTSACRHSVPKAVVLGLLHDLVALRAAVLHLTATGPTTHRHDRYPYHPCLAAARATKIFDDLREVHV